MEEEGHTNYFDGALDFSDGADSLDDDERRRLKEAQKVGALDVIKKLLKNRQKYFIHQLVEAENKKVADGLRGAITNLGSVPAIINTEIQKLEQNQSNEDD